MVYKAQYYPQPYTPHPMTDGYEHATFKRPGPAPTTGAGEDEGAAKGTRSGGSWGGSLSAGFFQYEGRIYCFLKPRWDVFVTRFIGV